MTTCTCPETKIDGEHRFFPHHSCAEVRRRNSYLAKVERDVLTRLEAEQVSRNKIERGNRFTSLFSRIMDRYCYANRGEFNAATFIQ